VKSIDERIKIAVAVVRHDGRFLIGPRGEGVPLAGLWEFPGGKVMPNETPERAAERECREETGLIVYVTGVYAVELHDYDHGRLELHFFACDLRGPKVRPNKPFRWVRRDELDRYQFPQANACLIHRLTEG